MTVSAGLRAIGLFSAAVILIVTFGLMAAGFDPVFAHGGGYAAGLIAWLGAKRWHAFGVSSDPDCDRALTVLAYAGAYTVSLGMLLASGSFINVYVAQAIAAVVFFGAFVVFVSFTAFAQSERIPAPWREMVSASSEQKVGLLEKLSIIAELARDRRIGRILLGLCIVIFLLADLRAFHHFYRTADERAAVPVYGRVTSWIEAAECFKKTGVIVATCDANGKPQPAEDATIADDRGHGLMLSALHRWFGVPATKHALVFVNVVFSVVALGLLAWQLVRLQRIVAAIVFLGLTLRLVSTGFFNSDVFSVFFGLFALSLLLPIQILRMFSQNQQRWSEWVWLAVSCFALVCTVLFREPIGLIGVIMTLLALAIGFWRRMRVSSSSSHWIVAGSAVVAVIIAVNAASLVIGYRSHFQGVPPGKGIVSHGIAHNLFIGLGSEPNPFGIEWSDTAGADAVKAVDPTIPYGSDKYFSTLVKLYFDVVREKPGAVIRIYASRMGRVLAPLIVPVLFIGLAAIIAGMAFNRREGSQNRYDGVALDLAIVTAIGTLLHCAQAILTVPVISYYFQANLGLYLVGALACDLWFRAIWRNPLARESSSIETR